MGRGLNACRSEPWRWGCLCCCPNFEGEALPRLSTSVRREVTLPKPVDGGERAAWASRPVSAPPANLSSARGQDRVVQQALRTLLGKPIFDGDFHSVELWLPPGPQPPSGISKKRKLFIRRYQRHCG